MLPPRSVICVLPNYASRQFLQAALSDHRVATVENAFEAIRGINSSAFDAYIINFWVA
jgi:hypothetical protein